MSALLVTAGRGRATPLGPITPAAYRRFLESPKVRRWAPRSCSARPGRTSRRAGGAARRLGALTPRPGGCPGWRWCCCGSCPARASTSPTCRRGRSPTGPTPLSTPGSTRCCGTCGPRARSRYGSGPRPRTAAGARRGSSRRPVPGGGSRTSSRARWTRSAPPSPSGCGRAAGSGAAVRRTATRSRGTCSGCRSPAGPRTTCGPGSARSGGATCGARRSPGWRWSSAARPTCPSSTGC